MASSQSVQYLAFDIYGTLLDTSSIISNLQSTLELDNDTAKQVSMLWRRYQLEYTWRLNSMDLYQPFDIVTQKSLLHAAAESGIKIFAPQAATLIDAYNRLQIFDDAWQAVQQLLQLANIKMMIFSNGTREMVTNALGTARLSSAFEDIFLADHVRQYKPSTTIYDGLVAHINSKEPTPIPPDNVWLISGNPFDVTGARAAGLRAIWVDRSGTGWIDEISPDGQDLGPSATVRGLGGITDFMRELA